MTDQPTQGRTQLLSPEEANAIHMQWSTAAQVSADVASWGFTPSPRPVHQPPVITPGLLTTPDTVQYTTVYSQLLEWNSYARELLAAVRMELKQTQNEMKRVAAHIKRTAIIDAANKNQKKPTKEYLDDMVELDQRWAELLLQEQIHSHRKELISEKVETYDKQLSLLSRNLELRKTDLENRWREQNLHHMGARPQGGMYPGGPR